MSKVFSPEEWVELRNQFEQKRDQQLQLVKEHELVGSYGMAYLALWAALEFFAKRLGPAAQKHALKEALVDWLAYLNGRRTDKPKGIGVSSFDIPGIETAKIPPETLLQKLFPLKSGPSFYFITNPTRKYRIKRNDIAHKGESPSLKVYTGQRRSSEGGCRN